MRCGTKENIKLDGKLHEIIKYDTSLLSAYKLSGFFGELFEKASNMKKDLIIRVDDGEIRDVIKHSVYFIPENEWESSAKQRDDYYGKFNIVIEDQDGKEIEIAAYDDCYNKKENKNTQRINHVKIIVSDAVVIEIKNQ
ncbi:MAG: hypothetical protein ACRC57_00775 [Sarcina sp.]